MLVRFLEYGHFIDTLVLAVYMAYFSEQKNMPLLERQETNSDESQREYV